jgi:hypothetical protein
MIDTGHYVYVDTDDDLIQIESDGMSAFLYTYGELTSTWLNNISPVINFPLLF